VSQSIATSLGPPIEKSDSSWVLDMTELPLFHGLSVLSRALAEMVRGQTNSDRIDINVERAIRPRENPELLNQLGVALVKICAEHATVASIAHHPELFEEHLRALLGTLQRKQYREALFASANGGTGSTALVFHFPFPMEGKPAQGDPSEGLSPKGISRTDEPVSFRFVLEFLPATNANYRGYLRVTIEDPRGRRLSLDSIPHVEIDDLDRRTFIAGSTRISQTWGEGVRRAAESRRRSFSEERSAYNHLFKQLDRAGLDHFQKVELSWDDEFVHHILESEPELVDNLLKKTLLALEDSEVRQLLERRETLRVDERGLSVYLESSQLARVLHLSLGQSRTSVEIDHFLERMPSMAGVVADPPTRLDDVAVFLIHHVTADVLGVIAGLRKLGCSDLTTLFVAYAGEAPGTYLAPLLDLPAEEFRCYALTSVPEHGSTEGQYRLSTQYSSLVGTERIAEALWRNAPRFHEAMQSTAKLLFLDQLERARQSGKRCLIIEDGGYLAPELNRACLANESVGAFLEREDPACEDTRPLAKLLDGCFVGSSEHTRNGFDRLRAVEDEYGRLAYPAFSIAISRLKVEKESREVAISILNAVENVLHATGMILSRRNCLVLGSRGAIGRALVEVLQHRLAVGALSGIDLLADDGAPPHPYAEAAHYRDLPDAVRARNDLIIGVIGQSILSGDDLAEWILRGDKQSLVLASGSTKTEEFKDIARYIDGLLASDRPEFEGVAGTVETHEVIDPMSGRVFGHRYAFTLGTRRRDVILLANLMPVNFMFYGVPTELIDEVLAELLSCSLGLVARVAAAEAIPAKLHAVDWAITPSGEAL